jgi:DeoR family transcriptional regulator, fructose operon transcriptional repressor
MTTRVTSDLAPRRRARLLALVAESGVIRVAELCKELDASAATVRRDLGELEGSGRIRRVHGGAVAVQSRLEEPLFDDKTSVAAKQKHRIAQAALKMIGRGETVYLDGGSTVLELARLLRDRGDVTVVTNSLRAALELGGKGPRLIFVGGELRRRSQTTVGPLTSALLDEVRLDKAFMGTMGVDVKQGITTTDPDEAHTKKAAMSRSQQIVLLADSSKIGKVSFVRSGEVTDVHVVITDKGVDPAFVRELRKRGVRVVKA